MFVPVGIIPFSQTDMATLLEVTIQNVAPPATSTDRAVRGSVVGQNQQELKASQSRVKFYILPVETKHDSTSFDLPSEFRDLPDFDH